MTTNKTLDLRIDRSLVKKIVIEMLRLFRGDNRRVMQQLSKGYGVLHKGALSAKDLQRHIDGEISAAIYLLDENKNCSTLCIDIDIPKKDIPENPHEREKKKREEVLPIITKIVSHLQSTYDIFKESFLLENTGGRGYHIWLFFENTQPAELVVNFLNEIKSNFYNKCIEIFPPSSNHGPTGFSKSNMRLPLGIHRMYQGSRSALLDIERYEEIPFSKSGEHLQNILFVPEEILEIAKELNNKKAAEILAENTKIKGYKRSDTAQKPVRYLAKIGKMISLCPALSELQTRAQQTGHLAHHERVALGIILRNCEDGEKRLHEILSFCTDYSPELTQKQFESLKIYYPISCSTLQSSKYNICPRWCCQPFEKAVRKGKSPTPLWFSHLRNSKDDIKTDGLELPIIEQIAEIHNLRHSWEQVKVQSKERDLFEDNLAFLAFEEHLLANLEVLRAELLSGEWKHQPFRILKVPKTKDDLKNVRPMCWSNIWDTIVSIAVLNIIGPLIDSNFHKNSLGNRLANSPKTDGQIFEDWRKQNRIREIKREGFSEYGDGYYYRLTDISRFYEFVQHDRLMTQLRKRIDDQKVLDIIQQYLYAEWLDGDAFFSKSTHQGHPVGLPQGPALSAFLANLYLDDLDHWLDQRCVDFVRYVDDLALLFENKEDAESELSELSHILEDKFGLKLNISTEKTTDPIPASNTDIIKDRFRDIRYELVRYSLKADSLTHFQKIQMRAALILVSGADLTKKEDLQRLVRYLGFYVASTERLEQKELQKSVYNLALYILNEERPKHNATCIAMRALVKACCEFGEEVWNELNKLLDSRKDEYIQVIFAQETRRFIEENIKEYEIPAELLIRLEHQAASSKTIASVSAITCLFFIGEKSVTGRNSLWPIVFSEKSYLRSRVAILLSKFKALKPAHVARIIPDNGEETLLLLFAYRDIQTKAVIDSLAEVLMQKSFVNHSVPALLYASIITNSNIGIKTSAKSSCFKLESSQREIGYPIAGKIIQGIILRKIQDLDFRSTIRIIIDAGLTAIASLLYYLGRYANIVDNIPAIDSLLSSYQTKEDEKQSLPKLPQIEEVELGNIILPLNNVSFGGACLHEAQDSQNNPMIHEMIAESEIKLIGEKVENLTLALNILKENEILRFDKVDIKTDRNTCYVLLINKKNNKEKSIYEVLRGQKDLIPEQIAGILSQTVELIDKVEKLYRKNKLSLALIPVPTTHTLIINDSNKMKFQNVTVTFAGNRQYIGISKQPFRLPYDEWIIYSLGLFFYELVTHRCAISDMRNYFENKISRLTETSETLSKDALLQGIIGKATANNRYESRQFFLNDVKEWCQLETSLKQHDLNEHQISRLKSLWNIQLGLERRVHVNVKNHQSFFNGSSALTTFVIQELDREEENGWLKSNFEEIVIQNNHFNPHVATIQLNQLADLVQKEWKNTCEIIDINRTFTIPAWIRIMAGINEIEAIRRIIYILARTKIRSSTEKFCIEVVTSFNEKRNFQLRLPNFSKAEKNNKFFEDLDNKEINRVAERFASWLFYKATKEKPIIDFEWPIDFLVMSILIQMTAEGFVIYYDDKESVKVGLEPHLNVYDKESCRNAIINLFNLYYSSVITKSSEIKESKFISYLANIFTNCMDSIYRLGFNHRVVNKLPKSAFENLYTNLVSINLGKTLGYQNEIILAKNHALLPFPILSPFHGKCVFSVDIFSKSNNKTPEIISLSLPPIVQQLDDEKSLPKLRIESKDIKPNRIFTLIKSTFGFHTFFPVISIGLYLFQVYIRSTNLIDKSPWLSAIDSWIGNVAIGIFLVPFGIVTWQRFKKLEKNT